MGAEAVPEFLRVAADVCQRLESAGVPFVIGGSLAGSVHGEPRATLDVDVVADLRSQTVAAFVNELGDDYYVDADVAHAAAQLGGSFNAVHLATGVKVDLFVAGDDPFEQERIRTREAVRLGGGHTVLWVDTAEHTLLRKLEWYRRGGEVSERQWRDVRAIAALQGRRLDVAELRRWAPALGVEDLLLRCLAEAGMSA
jgi:hypothetical protein